MKSQLLSLTKRKPKVRMISLITGAVIIGDETYYGPTIFGFKRPLALTIHDAKGSNAYRILFNEWAYGIDPKTEVIIERSKVTSYMVPQKTLQNLYLAQIDPAAYGPKEQAPIAPATGENLVDEPPGLVDSETNPLTEEEQINRLMAFKNFIKPTEH